MRVGGEEVVVRVEVCRKDRSSVGEAGGEEEEEEEEEERGTAPHRRRPKWRNWMSCR